MSSDNAAVVEAIVVESTNDTVNALSEGKDMLVFFSSCLHFLTCLLDSCSSKSSNAPLHCILLKLHG